MNRKVIVKIQVYSTSVNKLTASATAEKASSMLKLASESVRAVSEYKKALVNDSTVRGNFTSIILRLKNSDFLTQTQTDYQK